jgi:hypothetical protein
MLELLALLILIAPHAAAGAAPLKLPGHAAAVPIAAPAPARGAATAMRWGEEGHQIVCEIAWRRMTPAARTLTRDLLRGGEFATFAESCNWADEVRGTTHQETTAYHYINVPAGAPAPDLARDCADPEKRCVTWAIEHYARRLADRSLPPAQRREALKFVGHFVGDVHQPLHAGRVEDLGGNTIYVSFFGETRRGTSRLNLHQVWDRSIPRRAGLAWPSSAAALDAEITDLDVAAWSNLDALAWTTESHRIAEDFAYGAVPADGVLGNGYYRPGLGYAESQMQKAGVRLALIINHAAAGTLPL